MVLCKHKSCRKPRACLLSPSLSLSLRMQEQTFSIRMLSVVYSVVTGDLKKITFSLQLQSIKTSKLTSSHQWPHPWRGQAFIFSLRTRIDLRLICARNTRTADCPGDSNRVWFFHWSHGSCSVEIFYFQPASEPFYPKAPGCGCCNIIYLFIYLFLISEFRHFVYWFIAVKRTPSAQPALCLGMLQLVPEEHSALLLSCTAMSWEWGGKKCFSAALWTELCRIITYLWWLLTKLHLKVNILHCFCKHKVSKISFMRPS